MKFSYTDTFNLCSHAAHCILDAALCKMFTFECTDLHTALHCVLCTLQIRQCLGHSARSVHCTLHSAQHTLHTVYTAHYTVHSTLCTQFTLHSAQCTTHSAHSVHCTLHSAHFTLHQGWQLAICILERDWTFIFLRGPGIISWTQATTILYTALCAVV